MGCFLLKNKDIVKEQQETFSNPSSIDEYYQAFPQVITGFFDGLIGVLLSHHHKNAQKMRKSHSLKSGTFHFQEQEQNPMKLMKITTFFSSIINFSLINITYFLCNISYRST